MSGILALGCCCLFIWELRNAVRETQVVVRDADAAVKESQRRITDTAQNLNAALIQVGLATDEARRASMEQRQYWNQISKETIGLITDARATMRKTETSIDGVSTEVHSVAGDIHGFASDLHGVAGAAVTSLESVPPVLEQGSRTLESANALLTGPELTGSVKDLAEASRHLDGTVANVEMMSADIQQRLHKTLNQPKSLARIIFGWLLDTAYKVKAFF